MTIYEAVFHHDIPGRVESVREAADSDEVDESRVVNPWVGIPPQPAYLCQLELHAGVLGWRDLRNLEQKVADGKATVEAALAAADQRLVRPLADVMGAQLAGEPPASADVDVLTTLRAEKIALRSKLAALDACETLEDFAAITL